MYKDLLPIGSVVLIKGGEKRVMICGRIQAKADSDKIYDYSACYYPEGIIDPDTMFFFDNDSIENIFFIGFQDTEEIAFRTQVLEKLGKLEVRDGEIVQVDE